MTDTIRRLSKRLAGASLTFMTVAVACGAPVPTSTSSNATSSGEPYSECTVASDCENGGTGCVVWSCEVGQCKSTNAPEGSVPTGTSEQAPVCNKLVCDGRGNTMIAPDPTQTPPEGSASPCFSASCDASGSLTMTPDPSNVPPDTTPGDCMKPGCDAMGNITSVADPSDTPPIMQGTCQMPVCEADGGVGAAPDPSNLPAQMPGTCQMAGCDDMGNVTETPDPTNVPASTTCMAYTCNGTTPVGTPQNVGETCSNYGQVCSTMGMCNACPPMDSACDDPGPGKAATSFAAEHDFGQVGWCDDDGYSFCGALKAGETVYFGYTDTSSGLCDYDPFVEIIATGAVTVCEYFDTAASNLSCASPTVAATLNGLPGCCQTASSVTLQLTPNASQIQTYFTFKSESSSCVTYGATFHS